MNSPDIRNADFSALLNLAEARFMRWLKEKALPERDRQLQELKSEHLQFGGRALKMQRIWENFLLEGSRKRISQYAKVAYDSGNREMLSAERLGEFRDLIMVSVDHTCRTVIDDIERDARVVGNVSPAQIQAILAQTSRLRVKALDVVNDELKVLEAEGKLAGQVAGNPEPTTDAIARMDAVTVGPKPIQGIAEGAMSDLPELPAKFQNDFEADRANAELEYATRSERFPHHPHLAEIPLHGILLIQQVFFAFCTHARNACRAGAWSARQVSQSVEAAWPVICDAYIVRDRGGSAESRMILRVAIRRTVNDDPKWKQHLSELAALAATPKRGVVMPNTEAVNSEKRDAQEAEPAEKSPVMGPQFPKRASWLKTRLHERSWNKHDVGRNNGPHHKTVQKILDGEHVREDVLIKLAEALSAAPSSLKLQRVTLPDIPTN